MALAKLNLDPLPHVLGPLNLLHYTIAWLEDFQVPCCPNFTEVVFAAFPSAFSSRPDQRACTLVAIANLSATLLQSYYREQLAC